MAQATRAIAEATAARDAEIRRLRGQRPRPSGYAIAARVGCSPSMVYELANPQRRAAYNARRRKHWRV